MQVMTLIVYHLIILFVFLENTHGCNCPYDEARKFTSNIKKLILDMYTIYPHLTEKYMKNRFTRLIKKMKEHTDNQSETESIPSITLSSHTDFSEDEALSDSSQQSTK